MKREYLSSTALDKKFVEAVTKATLVCELNWREARKTNDFKLFAQYFSAVLKLIRETSERRAAVFNLSPYDALIDQYDIGRKSSQIDKIFADLENFLPNFIQEVKEKQASYKIIPFKQNFPIEKQKELGLACIKALGFNLDQGRLDVSAHPFSMSVGPSDVRMTTRYDEKDFLSGLFGVMHETGHSIYEQNLPQREALEFQPVARACGMTIHESQSLFVERQLTITKEFFTWLLPIINEKFGQSESLTIDNLYKMSTKVGPSLIRVDADEVTYPIHIIMRYKFEKAMLSGDLAVNDLPEAWGDEMYKLLQIKPADYKDGCLQDVHWAWGVFGYFPTYTLGAMLAAQINEVVAKSVDIPALVGTGNFSPIITWLKNHIHVYGSKYSADELIIKSTGKPLDVLPFKNYLRNKYL